MLSSMQGLFSGVIGADAMGDVCKPDLAAFEVALKAAGASAERCLMVEDSLKNLRTARSLGMATLLVHGHTAHEEGNSKYVRPSMLPLLCSLFAGCCCLQMSVSVCRLWTLRLFALRFYAGGPLEPSIHMCFHM